MSINPESFAEPAAGTRGEPSRHGSALAGAIALVASGAFGDALTNAIDFTNEPEAKEAARLVEDRLRGEEPDSELILVVSETATVEDPAFAEYVGALQEECKPSGPMS